MRIAWIEKNVVACGGIPVSLDNLSSLAEQGVRAMITLTEHPLTTQKAISNELLSELDFEVVHIPVVDQHPPTREQAQAALDFLGRMKAESKPTYLHCAAGIGRTGTMLHAMYLLAGMPFADVKQLIKSKRPSSQFFMLSDTQKTFLENLATDLENE